jgi:diacylglycerol kinase family enzyme
MDVAVVLNPRAGKGTGDELSRRVAELFAELGREAAVVTVHPGVDPSSRAGDAVAAGCRLLVAAGGDGTVSGVAQAVVGREVPLGVLPLGTLNHFARDLGLPLDLREAVRVAAQGVVRRVDVGQANGRCFLNNASIGVYPRIVELRHRYQRIGLGKWIAALWASLAVLRRRPFVVARIHLERETMVRRTPFVFVGNNEYRMLGLRGVHRPSLAGGKLAIYAMRAAGRVSLLRLAWEVLVRGVDRVEELDRFDAREAALETPRGGLQVALDGEVWTLRSPLVFRTRPLALRVMAPQSDQEP